MKDGLCLGCCASQKETMVGIKIKEGYVEVGFYLGWNVLVRVSCGFDWGVDEGGGEFGRGGGKGMGEVVVWRGVYYGHDGV